MTKRRNDVNKAVFSNRFVVASIKEKAFASAEYGILVKW
jgi:hypothetical protein